MAFSPRSRPLTQEEASEWLKIRSLGTKYKTMSPDTVAVLFARTDSVYKTIPGCDVWDETRNALLYLGSDPVVAHPPCRLWSRLAHMSSAPKKEKGLARFAVRTVQRVGGVLEHPAHSKLWADMNLPAVGQEDDKGFAIEVGQLWFGHPCNKKTWLYVSGIRMDECPPLPGTPRFHFTLLDLLAEITAYARYLRMSTKFSNLTDVTPRRWREATPEEFAKWLLKIARLCRKVPIKPALSANPAPPAAPLDV